MNKEEIEQTIYERTRRFVDDDVMDAIAYMLGAEREACANVAEKYGYDNFCGKTTDPIATAIRARGGA